MRRVAFTIRNGRSPLSMEEVIADDVLRAVVDKKMDTLRLPVAVIDPDVRCAHCAKVPGGEEVKE